MNSFNLILLTEKIEVILKLVFSAMLKDLK